MNEEKIVDIKRVNEILQSTVDNIKSGKDEVQEIVFQSKNEHERIKRQINILNKEIAEKTNQIEKTNRDSLIMTRDELEVGLKNSFELYKKAENLNKKMNVVSKYLMGNIDNIAYTVDKLNEKYILGIKIIEAQEEERLRLAREIHDGPAQSLASIIIKAELCERLIEKDIPKTKQEIIKLQSLTRHTLDNVRNVIYELRPMSLDDLGLIPTLERYIDDFKIENNIYINLIVIEKIRELDSAVEVNLFRIIQEALNNIKKHASASEAKIIIHQSTSKINVMISDDGVGFNAEDYLNSYGNINRGFGLISIKERAELLGGSLDIKSSKKQGTKLNIEIPMGEMVNEIK